MVPTTEKQPTLRERQRQEREAMILAEAERMLAERGYRESTMDELAERVGIGKGTIYLHFPSKEDLVRAIVERAIGRMASSLEAIAADRTSSAEARLRRIVGSLLEGKESWVHLMADQVRSVVMESLKHREGIREQQARLIAALIAVIDEGKANGEFSTAVASPTAAIGLFTLVRVTEMGLLQEMFNLERVSIIESMLHLYFRGLCTRGQEKEGQS